MYTVSLKKGCLGPAELLAQAVALISPTMTAALIIPVMYSNSGDWSWLSYAVGTVMLLLVALNLNQFAKRSTMAGSMYAYVCRGLGLGAGGVAGWSLIWAYLGIAMAGVTGFTIFAGKLLAMLGVDVPAPVLFAVCVGMAWYCAWRNVQLSAMLMLVLEGASMALIAVLCVVTLTQHGFAVDHAQFDPEGLHLSSLGLGVVVAIFSLVGFECATAFGDEARNPLVSIPRAVWLSLVISGVFFVCVTYVMVQATHGYATPLDQIDAPLNVMAELAGVPALQAPLSFAAMVSFFALCLSCLNAGGRVMFAMGRHGLFHATVGGAHSRNETPHVAVSIMAAIAFIVPCAMEFGGIKLLDAFNYAGTMAAFGFIVPYVLISLAAPAYLGSISQRRPIHIVICAVSLLLLAIPAIGSVYPVPAEPVMYFPYAFLVYLLAGVLWMLLLPYRKPAMRALIRADLDLAHSRNANI